MDLSGPCTSSAVTQAGSHLRSLVADVPAGPPRVAHGCCCPLSSEVLHRRLPALGAAF